MAVQVFLLTGSNLGNRGANLLSAKEMISERIGPVILASSVYESEPWGGASSGNFLNQVLMVQSGLRPESALSEALGIEAVLGRKRRIRWESRPIDIDILFYNSDVIEQPGLTVPHPGTVNRRFTLEPLAEIAPDFVHPLLHRKISALLEACTDPLKTWKYDSL